MARPLDAARFDDAIKLYLRGEPQSEILTATGISATSLHRERTRRGIPPRRLIDLPPAVVADYRSGVSEYALGQRYGTSRTVIRRHLQAAGIQIRGRSDAGKVRVATMTPKERVAQATAAHEAVRGTKHPEQRLSERALRRERRGLCDSAGEQRLLDWLVERDLHPVPQKAVGKYNLDLAVAPVAVEVLGGGWHGVKKGHRTRTPYILNAGWHLVMVWDHEGDSALSPGAADYVVAFLHEVRGNPPAVAQYRVISGSGQLLTCGSAEDDKFPLVAPPRGRQRSWT